MALEPRWARRARSVVAGGLRNTEPAFGSSSGSPRCARQQLFDACPGALLVAGAKTKQAARNHSSSPSLDPRQTRRGDSPSRNRPDCSSPQFPGARHRQHLRDDVPGFRPVKPAFIASLRRRARYSSEKTPRLQTARRREPRKLGTGEAGLGIDQSSLGTHHAPRACIRTTVPDSRHHAPEGCCQVRRSNSGSRWEALARNAVRSERSAGI